MTEYAVLEACVTPRQRFAAGQTVTAAEVEPGPSLDHYVSMGLAEVTSEDPPDEEPPAGPPSSNDSEPEAPVEES